VARLPLPDQGMTLIIPRGTTGAAVASQATENSALQNTDEVWGNLTVPVATIGGQQDVSRQSLERGTPGIDQLVYMDLAGAYHAELDRQVIAGSGASGQMLGMLNTAAPRRRPRSAGR
jgi:HK97 family phage major capsid protein